MKPLHALLLLASLLLSASSLVSAATSEIVKIKLFDGETLTGKLSLPSDTKSVQRLIVYIHGTGPGTYIKHRKIGSFEFNYFDLFAEEFTKRGVAFFAYNKRGVEEGDTPPNYETVDREKYEKCVPSIEVKDIDSVVNFLKADKRFKKTKIALLGWSEGTILASLVAEKNKNVNALFLAGYANDNLADIIKWQNSGAPSMLTIGKYFDSNKDNAISKEEYESSDKVATKVRETAMKNATFEQLDINHDNKVTAEDFGIINHARYERLLKAIDENDDDWIWNNYFRISSSWLKEHFQLEPNKTRLLRINIPIYIFHGDEDANAPVEGVYDLQERFAKSKKTNLQCFIFKGHDHDLNYMEWPRKKVISDGIQKIFETAEAF
jgi:dipeptidyl aminopeptidase/acylaminoacyl peptidase